MRGDTQHNTLSEVWFETQESNLCCVFYSLDVELVFSVIAAMEITNTKASFPHPSKSLLAYFEIPKEYLEKYLSAEKCQV